MNIAIDVRSLMEDRHSGVQEYTIELLRAFARVAPYHTYHLFYNSWRPIQLPEFGMPQAVVHGFRFPNKLFNLFQFAFGYPRWDTLFQADCFFIPHIRLAPLRRMTPIVATAHDISFARFPEFYSWRRRLWHRLMRPELLLQNANHVIAVSEATARDLREMYRIPADRIAVIHSGIAASQAASAQAVQAVKEKYELPERFVLYLGTLEPRKNIPSIIRAFECIAESVPHDLVIAGAPGWLIGEIDTVRRNSPVAERIHCLGFVTAEDKGALFTAATVFVYPSFYEGFGFPPLEALSAGTPVITSANSSLPEVVGEWATLINPYDPGELAPVMKEMLLSPRRVSPAARAAIRERFQWDTTARKTLQVLESVV